MMLRVSLAPPHRNVAAGAAPPLLDARGPRIVLGRTPREPVAPAADTLFGPRGALLAGLGGPLFVSDTGHHRLLAWRHVPEHDEAPADFVIGQSGFEGQSRNAGGMAGAATLQLPTGIACGAGTLAVADAWNHRVLLWHGLPSRPNQPADVVLGQADFRGTQANRGRPAPAADTLNACYGVLIHDERLFVADTGNRRVLMWSRIPTTNGAAADLVLGQRDFGTRDDNAAEHGGGVGMRWPHGMAAAGNALVVADAGCSRIMVWTALPRRNGAACDVVLGQRDFMGLDHNRGAYAPTASTLNMPYGVAVQDGGLVVADTANSRLLGFPFAAPGTGAEASRLAGQRTFEEKGENRWQPAARDSVCWPYAVAACGRTVVVADSGNNRIQIWDAA